MKLYRINQYETYMMSEQGVRFSINKPLENTPYYKAEVEEIEVEMPEGFSVRKDAVGNSYLMYGEDEVIIGKDNMGIFLEICRCFPKKVYVNII